MDVFNEQIVKRKNTMKDNLIRGLLVFVVILVFIISMLFLGGFAIVVTAAAGFGAYYIMSMLKIEYEYVFTNGELDIDVIYNQQRRKRLYSGHVNDFEIMAHTEDTMHAGAFGGAMETRDYSSGVTNENTYAALTNYKGKRIKLILEPNEKMLKAIGGVLTRRRLHIKQ